MTFIGVLGKIAEATALTGSMKALRENYSRVKICMYIRLLKS